MSPADGNGFANVIRGEGRVGVLEDEAIVERNQFEEFGMLDDRKTSG